MNSCDLYYGGTQINGSKVKVFPGENIYDAPPVANTLEEVPYLNGGILLYDGKYKNISQSYGVIITGESAADAKTERDKFVQRLLGTSPSLGWHQLKDGVNSTEFYEAYLPDGIKFMVSDDCKMYKTALNFIRKPQRFLTSGETITTYPYARLIEIPNTNNCMNSKPLITVNKGTGTGFAFELGIPGGLVQASGTLGSYVTIDCDAMTITSGSSDSTTTLILQGEPFLYGGSASDIEFISATNVASVDVKPRWWRL